MTMLIWAGLAAITTMQPPNVSPIHVADIAHAGTSVDLRYAPTVKLSTRQVGIAPPTRASTQRCNWSAELVVERHMTRAGANHAPLVRTLSHDDKLHGSVPGACSTAAPMIERSVAARSDVIRTQLAQIAERDRPVALAELDAASRLASN